MEKRWEVVHRAGLGSAAVSRLLWRLRGDVSWLCKFWFEFYFEAVESVFVEQESDWSNNKILETQN